MVSIFSFDSCSALKKKKKELKLNSTSAQKVWRPELSQTANWLNHRIASYWDVTRSVQQNCILDAIVCICNQNCKNYWHVAVVT